MVIQHLHVTGAGAGIIGIENASFTVEDSEIKGNDEDRISVLGGVHATIINNTITNNDQARLPNTGRGVLVSDSASADIMGNSIEDNRSDGIGVFDDGYARVEENTIQHNGRAAVFEYGIQVARGRVRANGNVIKDNGYAALGVFNDGSYRTGSFLNAEDQPDNAFPFEQINQGTGQLAVELDQMSFVDLRQVMVTGTVSVGRHSMLQVRGDNVEPNLACSTIDGNLNIFGIFAIARLRTTDVTGQIFVGPDARIDGSTACELAQRTDSR